MNQYDREVAHIMETFNTDAEYNKELERLYTSTQRNIQKEINSFMNQFAGNDNVDMVTVKQRVTNREMKAFYREVEDYIQEQEFNQRAQQEAEALIPKKKADGLGLLSVGVGLYLVSLAFKEEQLLIARIMDEVADEVTRQSSILGTPPISAIELRKLGADIVQQSWNGSDFSERVWRNQANLKAELDKVVRDTLINGKSPKGASDALREQAKGIFNTKEYEARRIAVTESARAQTEAQRYSYIQNGVKQYMYIAEPTACSDCLPMDGDIINVSDMNPGVNAPYIHPFCKCSTSAYIDREVFEADLTARGL